MKVESELPDYDKYFSRKLVSWVCKTEGFSSKRIKDITFKTCNTDFKAGYCWSGWLSNTVLFVNPDLKTPEVDGPVEGMIAAATVYVVLRRVMRARKPIRGAEQRLKYALKSAHKNIEAYRKDKAEKPSMETLFFSWCKPEKLRTKVEVSLVEQRAKKAQKMVKKWQRNLKLAQTKLKAWQKKVKYYEDKKS